jgi:glyoxylase-like metal-dependent hydrolase (beta-lactamase superfamily II)
MSLRRYLQAAAGSLFFCSAVLAQDQGRTGVVAGVHHVAGGVYMLDTDTTKFEGGNVAALLGDDGILLVDTSSFSGIKAIDAALNHLSDKPVRYVINTHCHGDHWAGNAAFQAAGATVIAQDNVLKRLEQKKCDGVTHGLPRITFATSLSLRFDGEEVTAIKVPTSHTDGDAIVYFKKANVVETGDVFVSIGLPFRSKYAGGDILGIADALREIVRRVPENAKVIPGHGPLSTIGDIRRAIRILDEMRDAISLQIKNGKTLDDLRVMQVLNPWKDAIGADAEESFLRDFYGALTGVPLEAKYRLD